MVQLRTQRTALGLYAILLVLPTVVLGFLQWHHIERERTSELEQLPDDAADARNRLGKEIKAALTDLLDAENRRGLEQYAALFTPDTSDGEFMLLPTSLRRELRPTQLLGWFSFDLAEGERAELHVFFGGDPPGEDDQRQVKEATRGLAHRFFTNEQMRSSIPLEPDSEKVPIALQALAASEASVDDEDCLRAAQMALRSVHTVHSDFSLLFFRSPEGVPRLVAYRYVIIESLPDLVGQQECLQKFTRGRRIVQGFFMDPAWYFDAQPAIAAAHVLNEKHERLLRESEVCCSGEHGEARLRLVGDMGFKCENEADAEYETVRVAIDTDQIEKRYRERLWRFVGVATMLVLTLATGVALLGRSVQKDLEQAQRTENFVAAVTHELRTPLSAIKLHGEMLLDGWAKDPQKQQEYYRRIVRETERLSTLVERVLEKAKLSSDTAAPEPGDLSDEVGRHVEKLLGWRTSEEPDLHFELAEDLPLVELTPDGVGSILVNLVENARKYAPVDPRRPGSEPIRVVTRRFGDGAALEVQDRGPGVAESERPKIFEAFYRVGNEATRTSRGTGLGLHLVALHAQSFGGKAEVEARSGGGSIFRVVFRAAPPEAS